MSADPTFLPRLCSLGMHAYPGRTGVPACVASTPTCASAVGRSATVTDSTLPSLDAIQARADARRDYADERPESLHVPEDYAALADESAADVPVLVAALRAVLALHEDDGHGECSHCPDPSDAHWSAPWPCPTVRAVTAHIDTTPKEKP